MQLSLHSYTMRVLAVGGWKDPIAERDAQVLQHLANVKQREIWVGEAYEQGKQAAYAAASWVTDGNDTDESRKQKLQGLRNLDPAVLDNLLPSYPNLSGEWAGDPTPQTLVIDIVGSAGLDEAEDESELIDLITNAWEEGVDENFYAFCEENLVKALGEEHHGN